MKAMVPTNSVSGFRKCGVYPFNPDAIVIGTPNGYPENATAGETTSGIAGNGDKGLSGIEQDNSEGDDVIDFTHEEEYRFERRYEKGYDLAWLKHHHPESVPTPHAHDGEVPSTLDASTHVPSSHRHELVSNNLTSTNHSQSSPITELVRTTDVYNA